MDGLSEPPRHVVVVSRFAVEGYLLINQPDVFGGNLEGSSRALQSGGNRLQGLDGLELHANPSEFCGGGGVKQ